MMIIFCSLCLISVSTSQNDYPINISDGLTLHSGDIITLQADDHTYLTKRSAGWTCKPRNCRDYYLALTEETKPDDFSEFVVETVGEDQIRLLDKDTERYLYVEDYGNELAIIRDLIKTETWGTKVTGGGIFSKALKSGFLGTIGMGAGEVFGKKLEDPIFLRPFIKTEGIRPDYKGVFKVEVFNKMSCPDIIALQVPAKKKYLKRFNTNLGGGAFNMITVESDRPRDEYDYSAFTIRRTGISPNYVQSVSNVTFDYNKLKQSDKPSVIVQFEPQENIGDSERYFTIEETYTTKKTNKWTFERGVELALGTKITANLQVPQIGAGFGAEVSTEIKTLTKNTNEYAEEEEHAVSWSQHVSIPPHTRVSASLTATEDMVDIPFTAEVYVKSEKTTYSYPVNGTYQGTRVIAVTVNITEEPLNQTHSIKPNIPQFDKQTPILLGRYPEAEIFGQARFQTHLLLNHK